MVEQAIGPGEILARRAQGGALGVRKTLASLALDDRAPVRWTPFDRARLA
jgi:hypothetical protein